MPRAADMAASASQSSSDAWQLAVQRYLASLPDAQKAAFKVPANAGMCLDMIIQAQGRKKGFTRLMELVKPLIDPLKRFEAAIDVIMQTHGAIASPIWGPLRMVITMASDHYKTLESLAMILYRVVGSLEKFTNYETLFKTNPAVQKAIGALYSDLIDFCTRVVQFHSRSSLRAMVTSFDKDFRDVSEHINFHSAEIDWVANAANIEESQRARQLEADNRLGKAAHILRSSSAFGIPLALMNSLQPAHCIFFAEAQILFSPNAQHCSTLALALERTR